MMNTTLEELRTRMNEAGIRARRAARSNDIIQDKARIAQQAAGHASERALVASKDYYLAMAGSVDTREEE